MLRSLPVKNTVPAFDPTLRWPHCIYLRWFDEGFCRLKLWRNVKMMRIILCGQQECGLTWHRRRRSRSQHLGQAWKRRKARKQRLHESLRLRSRRDNLFSKMSRGNNMESRFWKGYAASGDSKTHIRVLAAPMRLTNCEFWSCIDLLSTIPFVKEQLFTIDSNSCSLTLLEWSLIDGLVCKLHVANVAFAVFSGFWPCVILRRLFLLRGTKKTGGKKFQVRFLQTPGLELSII